MRSATVSIFKLCSLQNSMSWGTRAMVPSSFMISQMTPAGLNPAMRARSTEASVWPARTRTPPVRARSGKMWPGRARSCGLVFGSMAARMVMARSEALMPVVTPRRASIASQNAVPCTEVLTGDMSGRCDFLRGHGEVAFVFTVLVVDEDDHATLANFFDGFFDGGEMGFGVDHISK